MSTIVYRLSETDRADAGGRAARHSRDDVRKRVARNLLARLVFGRWGLERGLAVSDRDTLSQDVDTVELLDLNDVRIGDSRVNVGVLEGQADPGLRADRRSLECGLGADFYAFVELDGALEEARIAGVLPAAAYEEGDIDPSGDYLILDRGAARPPEDLAAMLRETGAGFEPLDRELEMAHDLVQPRIADYEAGRVDPMELPEFELHLFNCPACRKSLVRWRFLKSVDGRSALRQIIAGDSARPEPAREPRPSPGRLVQFRDAREYLQAMAAATNPRAVPVAGGPVGLEAWVPADEAFFPRCTESGAIEGTFTFPDPMEQWEGRRVRVEIDLTFAGESLPPWESEVRNGLLSIACHDPPAAVRLWIAESLKAKGYQTFRLPTEHIRLTLV